MDRLQGDAGRWPDRGIWSSREKCQSWRVSTGGGGQTGVRVASQGWKKTRGGQRISQEESKERFVTEPSEEPVHVGKATQAPRQRLASLCQVSVTSQVTFTKTSPGEAGAEPRPWAAGQDMKGIRNPPETSLHGPLCNPNRETPGRQSEGQEGHCSGYHARIEQGKCLYETTTFYSPGKSHAQRAPWTARPRLTEGTSRRPIAMGEGCHLGRLATRSEPVQEIWKTHKDTKASRQITVSQ